MDAGNLAMHATKLRCYLAALLFCLRFYFVWKDDYHYTKESISVDADPLMMFSFIFI